MAITQKQNTQIQLERHEKKKKKKKNPQPMVQNPQIQKKKIINKYKLESTNPIKKQIEKNITFLKHKPQQNHNEAKNKILA